MDITEVRIQLVPDRSDKLRAYCSITIGNAMVIRDLKIIDGLKGVFVAMPSRKLTDRCARCGGKNALRARFCNECGSRLSDRVPSAVGDKPRFHSDVAHPISAAARSELEAIVLKAFDQEIERSRRPGYRPVQVLAGSPDEEL
jgi:stage V sporulation protein G